MLLYGMIMLVVGIPMLGISIGIYKGKTNLIHDYHQTKVKDKAAYGKAFGKALAVMSLGLLLSGFVGLLGEETAIAAIAVLVIGLGAGILCIAAVQKKYNDGIF